MGDGHAVAEIGDTHMSLDASNYKAHLMRLHPQESEPLDVSEPFDVQRCYICLRALDAGAVTRRMIPLCSRHAKQDLGTFYMRMTDTGRFQVFPGEE